MGGTAGPLSLPLSKKVGLGLTSPPPSTQGKGGEGPLRQRPDGGALADTHLSPKTGSSHQDVLQKPRQSLLGHRSSLCLQPLPPQFGLLNSALAQSRGAPHPPGSGPLSTWETGAGGAGGSPEASHGPLCGCCAFAVWVCSASSRPQGRPRRSESGHHGTCLCAQPWPQTPPPARTRLQGWARSAVSI